MSKCNGKTDFIGKASKAAGGWGALKSSGKQILQSGAALMMQTFARLYQLRRKRRVQRRILLTV